ncbi:hypothetical protein DO72_3850 [Burkholderia pseudomallei]|nr:hypothetical protein DO72_3850 [Burkholderia pseudomallei]
MRVAPRAARVQAMRGAAMRAAGPPRRAGRRLRVDAGPMQLHPARRMRERREAGRAIQRVYNACASLVTRATRRSARTASCANTRSISARPSPLPRCSFGTNTSHRYANAA